jgi:glycosyltransferase involved in cell wall biosynthesis
MEYYPISLDQELVRYMQNNKTPSILALIGDYKYKEPIGTAVYSKKFVKVIEKLDLNIDLYILSLSETKNSRLLNGLTLPLQGNPALFLLFRKIIFIAKTAKQAIIKKPEVVLCLEENLSPLCLLLNYFFRIKYTIFAHDPKSWNGGRLRKSLTRANWIVANSIKTKQSIMKQLSIAEEKFFVIHPYVDEECFYPQERNYELIKKYNLENHKVVLTVGRIDKDGLEKKRQDLVIKAISIVKRKIPNIKYLIVGPGDQRESLTDLAKACGVMENVVFAGSIPEKDLREYYNLCDLFMMPSKSEGFGMSYLEALACGKPVIGGAGTGAEDALMKGKLGFLVNPDDFNMLAQTTIEILQGNSNSNLINPDYLRKTVLSYYGPDRFSQKLENLLKIITL